MRNSDFFHGDLNGKNYQLNQKIRVIANHLSILKNLLFLIFICLNNQVVFSQKSQVIINLGWGEMVKDNDVEAFKCFNDNKPLIYI